MSNILLHQFKTPAPTIAIIGGGLSGALVAVHLLKTAQTPLKILLIDRTGQWGKGIAYSTSLSCHLLNVPVGRISAFPDEPDHFLQWLRYNADPLLADAMAFVPRRLYGEYIQSLLNVTERAASATVQLIRIPDEVHSLTPQARGFEIQFSHGVTQFADRVVLALGNLPPRNPAIANPTFYQSDRYIAALWADPSLRSVATKDAIVLIGTGLTAIDGVMTLQQRRHQGQIHLVSRRGVIPQVHHSTRFYPLTLPHPVPQGLRDWVRWVRQTIAHASAQGEDWRLVLDGLRPFTSSLWQQLSLADQRRFLRHVRPYWDNHRHRMAPAIAQVIAELQTTGQLQIHAGRILTLEDDGAGVTVTLRQRHCQALTSLRVQHVINCTSPNTSYAYSSDPLLTNLIKAGLIRCDRLNLGIDTTVNGAVLSANGMPSTRLYTLGNAMRGLLWETTAIPEIRKQAQDLAQTLLFSLDLESSQPQWLTHGAL